jgi:hypothetical protein
VPDRHLETLIERDQIAFGADALDDEGDLAHAAADEAGFCEERDGTFTTGESLLYAVGGRAYDPERAPARVFLKIDPGRDHAHDCPARSGSDYSFGRGFTKVEATGPCACLVRAYPLKDTPAPGGST